MFVAFGECLQVIHVVVVVSRRTQDLEGQVADDRRRSEGEKKNTFVSVKISIIVVLVKRWINALKTECGN